MRNEFEVVVDDLDDAGRKMRDKAERTRSVKKKFAGAPTVPAMFGRSARAAALGATHQAGHAIVREVIGALAEDLTVFEDRLRKTRKAYQDGDAASAAVIARGTAKGSPRPGRPLPGGGPGRPAVPGLPAMPPVLPHVPVSVPDAVQQDTSLGDTVRDVVGGTASDVAGAVKNVFK